MSLLQNNSEYNDALQELSRELLCSICLSIFRNPHNLTCNHIFCLKCIKLSLKAKGQCPLCKKTVSKRSLSANAQLNNIVKLYYGLDPNAHEESDDDEAEEIVDALRSNTPTNSDDENDHDDEYIPKQQAQVTRTKHTAEVSESPSKKRSRSPRKLYSTVRGIQTEKFNLNYKGASINVSLKDLVLANILKPGQELLYKGEVGILQHDGCIHYEGEDYKSLSTWSTLVGHKKGLSANTKKNGWDCVTANGKLVKYYRDQYDKNASFYPSLDSTNVDNFDKPDELDLPNIQEETSVKRQLFVPASSEEEEDFEEELELKRAKHCSSPPEEIVICSSPSPIRSSSPDPILIHPSPHSKMMLKINESLDKHKTSIEEFDKLMSSQEVISLLDEEDVKIVEKPIVKSSTIVREDSRNIVILGTGLKSDMIQQLYLTSQFLGAKIVSEFSEEVSHIVTCVDTQKRTKRTIKYFFGLMHKKWILSFDWILRSRKEGKWVSENEFEVVGDTFTDGAPLKYRTNPCKIFEGHSFFFQGIMPPSPARNELETLCRMGGGTILTKLPDFPKCSDELESPLCHVISDISGCTQEQAKVIFYTCGYSPISINWILDSISSFDLLPINAYYLYSQNQFEDVNLSQEF